jgi:riboflavin kinase/FMN adenylyltransferase
MKVIKISGMADMGYQPLKRAIALGNFDGVHIAHQEIIRRCVECAKSKQIIATVLTFYPHPRKVISSKQEYSYLTSQDDKFQLMESLGVEEVYVINFDQNFSQLSPQSFIERYVNTLNAAWIFTGYNFYFGLNRSGDANWLSSNALSLGFDYQMVQEIDAAGVAVSSSNVKAMLKLGMMAAVGKMLDRYYSISGVVTKGAGEGTKTFGVPTANIDLDCEVALPLLGAYVIKASYLGKSSYGVASIGFRPSVNEVAYPLLEVHLFDVKIDLYGEKLEVEFLQLLHPERKFYNLDALKWQIHEDIRIARYVIKNLN